MSWGVPKLGTLVEDPVSGGNFTLIEPAGVAQGDLMVACIAYRGNAAIGAPAGWSTVATAQNSGDTDATNGIASGVMFYITRGASAPDLVCTRTGGDVVQARVVSYSGYSGVHDTGTANTLGANSATATTGTFNTAEANELIVAMVSGGDNYSVSTGFDAATDPTTASGTTADTATAPTAGTWILRHVSGTGTGADSTLAFADAIRATAGATGELSVVLSGSARQVMIAGAFKMAAAGATLTANTGTFSETGVAPNLLRGRNLNAETQTYALTGTAVGLAKGKKLTADLGTFTASGVDVTFNRTYVLSAEVGSFTETGINPNLLFGHKIIPDLGSYAIGLGSTLDAQLIAFWKLEEASGTRTDEVGTNDLSDNNTVTQATGKIGNAAQFTAVNNEWLSITSNTDVQTGDIDFTFACWVWLSTGGLDYRNILGKYGVEREYLLWWYDTFRWTCPEASAVTATNFGSAARETWHFVIAWHDSVNNQIGISINNGTPNTAAAANGPTAGGDDFHIGKLEGGIGYADGRIDAVGFWKRVLTADERTELYNSGNGREYPFSTAAAAALVQGYRLIADVGSFALTGIAPTLTATTAKKLTADVGTFALAGVAPTLQLAHKLTAETGTFAASGVAPTLQAAHKLATEVGTLVLSGVAPTLQVAKRLTADVGTYTLTGVSPNLVTGGNPVMTADPGSFAVAGVAPTLAIGHRLVNETGSFAVAGVAPGLSLGRRIVASVGSFSLTGIAATLTATQAEAVIVNPVIGATGIIPELATAPGVSTAILPALIAAPGGATATFTLVINAAGTAAGVVADVIAASYGAAIVSSDLEQGGLGGALIGELPLPAGLVASLD